MHPVIAKTFGGLSRQYYWRQMFFSLLIGVIAVSMSVNGRHAASFGLLTIIVLNTLLYPYARFVYESVVGFILGQNMFVMNAIFMMAAKCVTMLLCWFLAVFIAPIGLIYLYIHHGKVEPPAQG